VGANDGAEIDWYLTNSCSPVLCFEPHPAAVERARERWSAWPQVTYVQCALGAENGQVSFTIPADGDDEKTSRYQPIPTPGHDWTLVAAGEQILCPVLRFEDWVNHNHFDLSGFNGLVVDAQGMEQEVLEGFGPYLQSFDFLCVELSRHPVYQGEVAGNDVARWLETRGYRQESPLDQHHDVLFVAVRIALPVLR
jgi:FkbM family methyltransferase